MQVTDSEGTMYTVSKLTDNIYTLAADDLVEVARYSGVTLIASYDKIHQAFTYTDAEAFAAEAADGEEEPAAEGEEPSRPRPSPPSRPTLRPPPRPPSRPARRPSPATASPTPWR